MAGAREMPPESFDALATRLRRNESGFVAKLAERLRWLERWRPWLIGLGALGALLAALARVVPGAVGLSLTIIGATVAGLAALAVAAFDCRKIELGTEVTSVQAIAEEAIAAGKAIAADRDLLQTGAEALDRRRRERLIAIEQMLQAMEAGLLQGDDAAAIADQLLKQSIFAIRKAIDFRGYEFLTVSIFRRQTVDGREVMHRIAAQWTDPERAAAGGRDWVLGEGYTGMAWQNATTNPNGDVIERDTTDPEIRRRYPVKNPDPAREALYKSVVAVPILIRSTNDVWGVVTATSDRIGMFTRDRGHIEVQNVEMIRDVARVAALLAGTRDRLMA